MALTLDEVIRGIEPASQEYRLKAREYLNNLTAPLGSLGDLLVLAEQLAAIGRTLKPSVGNKVVVTMAGDHGVVAEGVSAYPQEVTPEMVANFVAGGAAINVLAAVVGASVQVVDMGVVADLSEGTGGAVPGGGNQHRGRSGQRRCGTGWHRGHGNRQHHSEQCYSGRHLGTAGREGHRQGHRSQ